MDLSEFHTIGVNFEGNEFSFYHNDEFLGSWIDNSNEFTEGYVGMAAYEIQEARFDDFEVRDRY